MLSIRDKQRLKRAAACAWGTLGRTRDISVILNYHSVHPTHPYATTPGDFRAQLGYLKENFSVLSLSELYRYRAEGAELPSRAAVITFDDGFRDNYDHAYPVLCELGLPATVFLSTGFVSGELDITTGWPDYRGLDHLEWSQVREMSRNGIGFGAHTHTHPILSQLTLARAEEEIVRSRRVLELQLGEPPRHFAYPLGQPRTFNPAIIGLLKKHGFELACSTIWGNRNGATDLFALHRIRIDSCDSFADFVAKIQGDWNFIQAVQSLRG